MPLGNLTQIMRGRKLFGNPNTSVPLPMNQPSMRYRPSPEDMSPSMDTPDEEGPMMRGYRSAVEEGDPIRNEHPGKMARLAAALGGISEGYKGRDGYGTARDILDRPYNEAMAARKVKLSSLLEGAKLEDTSGDKAINREIKLGQLGVNRDRAGTYSMAQDSLAKTREARQAMQAKINAGKATDAEKQQWVMEGIKERGNQARENISAQGDENATLENLRQDGRTAIAQMKIDHPNKTVVRVPGANIILVDPQTGEATDTGQSSGLFTESDLIEMRKKAAIETKQTPGAGSESEATAEVDDKGNVTGIKRTTKSVAPPKADTTGVVAKPTKMTDKSGNVYDTSTWSDEDIKQAKIAGFK